MPITPHISPRIIPSIASLYNDVNRIFMEYIDNSLDSAEEFYEQSNNAYNKKIEISLKIQGNDYKDGKVIINDNCFGITKFKKLVENIGNSDKKAQPWTNGQFGYGIYSFMAACSNLEITSKLQQDPKALYIPINKKQFDTDRLKDVYFPDPKKVTFSEESGTKIVLSEFEKENWKQINIEELKAEIEKHFELFLTRKNLKIKLMFDNLDLTCSPFNYKQYEGDSYEDHVGELTLNDKRMSHKNTKLKLPNAIHIFIKVTKGKEINKRPVFIYKGRRIAEIKDVKQFHSKHKSDLWDHPNVTGYLDLDSIEQIQPTIARNDFKNNTHARALFFTLLEIEPLILDVVKEVNKKSEERHYKELEDRLNDVLAKLAKSDSMFFRTDYLSGDTINLDKDGAGQNLHDGNGVKDRSLNDLNNFGTNSKFGENEGNNSGKEPSGNGGKIPGGSKGGNSGLNKEAQDPFNDSEFKGSEKKKSGFNIRIVDLEPDIDSTTSQQLRSVLVGSEIRIFKQHSDFINRVGENRQGEKRITERLITYLAGEITVHYKDKFHNKTGQPEYNKNLFVDLVDFVYKFENLLSNLAGKNLSDLEN